MKKMKKMKKMILAKPKPLSFRTWSGIS